MVALAIGTGPGQRAPQWAPGGKVQFFSQLCTFCTLDSGPTKRTVEGLRDTGGILGTGFTAYPTP